MADITSNLQGWWRFEEGAGTVATDSISTHNTATLINAPGWVAGKFGGNAINFSSGTTQYASVGNPSAIDITGSLTVAIWVKIATFPTGGNGYQFIAKDKNTGRSYTLDWNSATNNPPTTYGGFRFYINGGATAGNVISDSSFTPGTGVWYHVAGVYDASAQTCKIYINGSSGGSTTGADASINSTASNLLIGRREYPGYEENFDGQMNDARIYNRALSAADVLALYNFSGADLTTGLVGRWKLDEASGTTAIDSIGSNNGTHVNSPSYLVPGKIGTSAIQYVKTSSQYTNVDGFTNNLTDFTVCAWFKPQTIGTGNYQRIVDKMYTDGFWMGHDGGAGDNAKWGGGILQSTAPYGLYVTVPDVTAWNFLCNARNGTLQTINLNGGAVTATQTVPSTALSSEVLTFGSSRSGGVHTGGNANDDFDGYIDEIRIYNRGLSPVDMVSLYAFTEPIVTTGNPAFLLKMI